MKIFSTLILIAISLCAGLCCPPEDDYDYDHFNIINDSIISIENDKTVFKLKDTIYINSFIKNSQITVEKENIVLSDFLDLDTNPYVQYNLVLYKETSFGSLAKIKVTNSNLVTLDGLVENDYEETITVKNIYNTDDFTSKFGIKLLETGTYYLASANLEYAQHIDINVYSNYRDSATIATKIKNADDNGAYKFIVE